MNDNEQNKPTEPQEPDVSLRDRRRILEELTPNVSAKQLSEQLARMKREADEADSDSASENSTNSVNSDAEGNAMNNNAGSSSQSSRESDQNNHHSDSKPESSESQSAGSDPSMTDEPHYEPLHEPRRSTLETRAVIISSEPIPGSEKPQSPAIAETRPEMPAASRPISSDGEDEPSEEIALTSAQPETPTDTALLTDDKPQRPAQSMASSTSRMPDDIGEGEQSEPEEAAGAAAAPTTEPTGGDTSSRDVDDLEDSLNKELLNKHDTAILANKPQVRRALQQQATGEHQTSSLGENREIILVIRGMVERLILPDDKRIILGRTDVKSRFLPDVDLTPYGALDRGVSREHASLHLQGDRLFVTDLNSTNGTYLAGKKLDPHTPSVLRKGDELLLGRLPVQVLFR